MNDQQNDPKQEDTTNQDEVVDMDEASKEVVEGAEEVSDESDDDDDDDTDIADDESVEEETEEVPTEKTDE